MNSDVKLDAEVPYSFNFKASQPTVVSPSLVLQQGSAAHGRLASQELRGFFLTTFVYRFGVFRQGL